MSDFIDTHTHIYLDDFAADRDDVIRRAQDAGATRLLLPNIDEASLESMLRLCAEWPLLCCPMIGLHPTELPADPWPALKRMEHWLSTEAGRFVAVGEVGLDFYWDNSRRGEQIAVFRKQAEWAVQYDLPLMVHSRSAHRELVDTLRPLSDRLAGGVFHCFGGTADEARELLSFPGFALGVGGIVTFRKSTLPAVLAEVVPLDRIVLETDAPYLAPTPHRGQRNEPAYLPLVIERLAQIYDVTPDEVAARTTLTAERLFLN